MALVVLFAATAVASAQSQWISPNDSPPDTVPTIELDEEASDSGRSVFDIHLNGLWVTGTSVEDQVFHRLEIPGHRSRIRSVGRPAIPRISLLLHIPTIAEQITVGQVDVFASHSISGIHPFPAQHPELELPGGNYERPPFAYNPTFYTQTEGPLPSQVAIVGDAGGTLRRVRVQNVLVQPVRSLPSQNALILDWDLRVEFLHPGLPTGPIMMTKRSSRLMQSLLDNTTTLPSNWWIDQVSYDGCYLVVTPPEYEDELEPLVRLKREQGYRTTVKTTDDTGDSASDVKTAIETWYDNCGDQADAYVLLIGDVDQIPMHIDPEFGNPSDHYYACLDGDPTDIYPEVGLGRLSVDNEADCAEQVDKIVRYQDAPPSSADFYNRIELIAHEELSNDGTPKYAEIMQEISTWMAYYASEFDVTDRFGTAPDGLVSNVVGDLNDGRNITVYRGHGSKSAWTSWDFNTAFFLESDILGLTNGEETGLVVSIACTNNALDQDDDCFGETFMEGSEHGAVAHYGATRASWTSPNHDLAYWFMVLGRPYAEFTTLADGFAATWFMLLAEWDNSSLARKNEWIYLLLGEPVMKLWSGNPRAMLATGPTMFGTSDTHLPISVSGADGEPLEGVIVTVVHGEMLIGNLYTDGFGQALIPIDGVDSGELVVRAYSDFDDSLSHRIVIPVNDGCTDTAGCADVDANGIRDDNCSWNDCDGGTCTSVDIVFADMGGAFGACSVDGFANIHDRTLALACFAGTTTCDSVNIDAGGAFGSCTPDGFCNIHDVNLALAAFAGTTTCTCPPGPSPESPADIHGSAELRLVPRSATGKPGDAIEVDVFIDGPVESLRGYQLETIVSGGLQGALALVDVHIDRRKESVFVGRLDAVDAFNVANSQMLASLGADEGIRVARSSYLATFVYDTAKAARGTFVVDVNHGQTYLLAPHDSMIAVDSAIPALIRVRSAARQSR
jgi:hypothetical protein